MIERLEDRCFLSTTAVPTGPQAAAIAGLTPRQAARADVVVEWNSTALQAIWNAATPPTRATRTLAMLGIAVYDAVDGIARHWKPYPVPGLTGRAAPGASARAAAIAAADAVLNSAYPDQQALFDAEYSATLNALPDNVARARGVAWGQNVADAVIRWRSQDGSNATATYIPAAAGGVPGDYELTPTGFKAALDPLWGNVTPWAMSSAAQFQPPPPPELAGAQYADDFNKTKALGGVDSTVRTEDQTQYANFWADVPGKSVTPPGHWNEIAEHVSLQRGLGLAQNARLFGLLNAGLADAAIDCWNVKYVDNFWRPVTAINDARASDINAATSSDPNWKPLWSTPNFPGYMSGHSTFSGTAESILTATFGRQVHFSVGSDAMPGYARSFTSFKAAADEAGESRIVGGIHFEFDNQAGLASGRALGTYIARKFMGPL
jgi:hypothetical protein